MKLKDLDPRYGEERTGERDKLIFDCPKCKAHRIAVPILTHPRAWQLTGNQDDFDSITIAPSIDHDAPGYKCHSHFFIQAGEIINA